ncbi:MAG: DUF882 domain-containing protein [Deltaproteobacteria bacterium]|nr:DUF882 domain-containing protein [Deltaproteobacteria bacterium]
MKILSLLLLSVFASYPTQRYFFHGDGKLVVKEKKQALQNLSPRLIALLDYLQEKLGDGKKEIQILSGYRSPKYNETLRKKGRLAGKASLHTEGMAVDFTMEGVDAKKIWEFVRAMNCCGVGYYHGNAVHIDTGPARFWDETSSKVFTDISSHNKQIYLTTQYDIYKPGEKIHFDIVRITEYPFGVQMGKECVSIASKKEAQHLTFDRKLKKRKGEPQTLKLKVCQKPSPEMPDTILSNTFIIDSPK